MNYDLIIVGGGIAGASLALALSSQTQHKIKLALIEKRPLQQHQQSGFDSRCLALSAGSCQRFAQIRLTNQQSLWDKIQPISTAIKQIHVSDAGHSGIVQFNAQEFAITQLGAVVELSQVGHLLLQEIKQATNIDYFCPAEIEQIELETKQVKILIKSSTTYQQLQAPLVVGADGSHSMLAKAAKIEQNTQREYGQTAIITNIRPQLAHHNRAFERFTEQGPVALLPMEKNLMSLVWCTRQPSVLMEMNETDFLYQLQQTFGWRLGKFEQAGARFAYPLNLIVANQHSQGRIALIGNAAQTLHPVAGQGFNLSIRDLTQLSELVSQAFKNGADLGNHDLLQRYNQLRQEDQKRIINLTDGLISIFANNLLPYQISRNLGLITLAQSSLLRQYFAKPTLGWL